MHALQTAATGMAAQDLHVQVISNNIANMATTGYKRQRAEFSDLLYEHLRRIGTQSSDQGNILPVGIDLGSGVKPVGTPRVMTQGSLSQTGNAFDLAITGEGFFKVGADRLIAVQEFGRVERDRFDRHHLMLQLSSKRFRHLDVVRLRGFVATA
jgi:flagellar hook-basal body protein